MCAIVRRILCRAVHEACNKMSLTTRYCWITLAQRSFLWKSGHEPVLARFPESRRS